MSTVVDKHIKKTSKTLSKIRTCICGKTYKHRSSLSRHQKTCSVHKDIKVQDDLASLISKNNELLVKLASKTNIIRQQNIVQNNIKNDITFKI